MKQYIREPVNSALHLAGAVLSVAGLVWVLVDTLGDGAAPGVWSLAVFGGTMILLFTMSTLYHSLPISERGVAFMRRLDHMSIFVFIAGTFTPVCVLLLRGWLGWTLFIIVWSVAAAGLMMKLAWMHAPRWLSVLTYIAMGWLGLISVPRLVAVAPTTMLAWLAAGGLLYTVGAGVYALRRPNPFPGLFGFHEIWHCFVLAGAFSHFWAIRTYVAPYAIAAAS